MTYTKLLLCTKCTKPYARSEVGTKAESQTEQYGRCYNCNLAAIRTAAKRKARAKDKAVHDFLVARKKAELDAAIDKHLAKPQTVIQTGISLGDVPAPPLEALFTEPDVIEQRDETGRVIMTWAKHSVDGLKYYEDQNGNKWHYQKIL